MRRTFRTPPTRCGYSAFISIKSCQELTESLAAPEHRYETDSLGKTSTAALIGVAVQQGLVDIDRPIREYGVKPQANWSASSWHTRTASPESALPLTFNIMRGVFI